MSLTRIVPWSQQLACEVLRPGDLAVDLTAGKGRDTLALANAVGGEGQVLAVDLQDTALAQTELLLKGEGCHALRWPADKVLPHRPGVYLVQACHSALAGLLDRSARAVMANLGYLPGGDPALVTRPETTIAALEKALDLLAPGGRLVVTVYPGHSGGEAEAEAVDALLGALPRSSWMVLFLTVANRPEAPRLRVAERLQA